MERENLEGSDASLTLTDFLSQLTAEGRPDSSGSFTLDPVKAREKLERFQFRTPFSYVFPLLAAATPLRSWSLAVTAQAFDIDFLYHCPSLKPDILESLLSCAFNRRDPGLSHLALGVVGAARHPGAKVILESGSAQLAIDGKVTRLTLGQAEVGLSSRRGLLE